MVLDSRRATVTLSPVRQQSFAACLSPFTLRAHRDWRVCLRLMGLMAAMVQIVPLALLHMRPVQRCLLSVGLCAQSPARAKVTVSQRLYRALRNSPPDRIYRRIPSRLGSRTQRSGYQRTLEGPLGVSAYQLVGAEGGLSSPKPLSAAAQGTACHSQNRQHSDSCVHQQAGGFGLPNPLQAGNSSVAMG